MIPRSVRHTAQPPGGPVQPALGIPHRGVRLLEELLMQVEFMADGEGEIVLPCDARAEEGEAGVLVCRMRREWEKGMNGAESRAYRP